MKNRQKEDRQIRSYNPKKIERERCVTMMILIVVSGTIKIQDNRKQRNWTRRITQ